MSEDFIGRSEFYGALQTRDTELREHFDNVCGTALLKIADTEKLMGEKLSKNIRWLIGTLILVTGTYFTIAVTLNVSAAAEQSAVDAEQNHQMLDAWRAIESSAAILTEHSSASKREFDQTSGAISEIRRETQERIQKLEEVQREHERSEKGH
jgi:hypothetical protein